MGMSWGLPNEDRYQSLHPDEPVIWQYAQGLEPAKLQLSPGFYNYGTLYLTTLKVASDMVAVYSGAPPAAERQRSWQFAGACHLAGRWVNAIAGSATALLVFFMLRRRVGPFASAMGAGLVAFAPGFVVHSKFQTVDVFATFLLTVGAFYAFRVWDELAPDLESLNTKLVQKFVLLSGLFFGLSAGTKYTGILGVLILGTILVMRKPKSVGMLVGLGIGMALLGMVIGTPGILTDTAAFWRDFKYEMIHTSTGHGLVFEGMASGFLVHIMNLIAGVGLVLLFCSVAGIGWGLRNKANWMLPLLAFALPYYFLIGRAEVLFLRYTFPLIPILAMGFGYLVQEAENRKQSVLGKVLIAISILALGGVFRGGARDALEASLLMMGPDNRDRAAWDLRKEVEKNPRLTIGVANDPWFYSPPVKPFVAVRQTEDGQVYREFGRAELPPQILRYVPSDGSPRESWDVRLLTELKPDLIMFSSFESVDLARLSQRKDLKPDVQIQVDRYKAFLQQLDNDYVLDRSYISTVDVQSLPHDMLYVRPNVYIWKRKTN